MENINPSESKFIFRKEREFGEIISDTFSFFSQNHKALSQIFLKYIGPFVLLSIVATTFYQYKTGDLIGDVTVWSTNPDVATRAIGENILVLLLFAVVSVVTYMVLYGTVLHSIKSYIKNEGEISETEVYQGIKDDFWKILGYTILSGLVAGIGFVLCILPGVYLYVVLTPGIALLVMENESVSETFSKCFKIIKDNWWITFATLIVFAILIFILNLVFQLPAFLYGIFAGLSGLEEIASESGDVAKIYQDWVFLLFNAIAVVGQYFLNIFTIIMVALVYFNLSEQQEFRGTYDQIDQIGN